MTAGVALTPRRRYRMSWPRGIARGLVVVRQPAVSFAASAQLLLRCDGCGRLFKTTNTAQERCSLACADWEARHALD